MAVKHDSIDYLLKIVMLGESSVGKTNIIGRYVYDEFSTNIAPTIGVDSSLKTIDINGKRVKLQIWDTAGQEKFRVISSAYYKNAVGAVLVYDIAKRESFNKLTFWINELRDNASEHISVILLGNKSDLTGEREVATEEAREFAEKQGYFFMEVSAKENDNDCVSKGFEHLVQTILDSMDAENEVKNKRETILRVSNYEIAEKQKSEMAVPKKKCC